MVYATRATLSTTAPCIHTRARKSISRKEEEGREREARGRSKEYRPDKLVIGPIIGSSEETFVLCWSFCYILFNI